MAVAHGKPLRTTPTAPTAPTTQRSFRGFLKAVKHRDDRTLETIYGSGWERTKAAMGEESGQIGGYLVPLDYSARLLKTIAEESFLYAKATVVPMVAPEMYLPQIDSETAPTVAGTSPFFGSMIFTWGQSQVPGETEPLFRQFDLKAWDLLGRTTVSNQWLMDVGGGDYSMSVATSLNGLEKELQPAGEEFLLELFGKAATWYAEYAFLRGTGVAAQMPLGIVNAPALKAVTRSGGSLIALADVALMAASLIPSGWKNAVWACHPTCLAQVMKITTYFVNGGTVADPLAAGTLMTRPLYITEKLPALGTAGDILLFDPTLYVIGERQQILIDVSEQPGFRTNQTDYRVWLRLDGRPWLKSTVTLQDTSTTVSGYVALAA